MKKLIIFQVMIAMLSMTSCNQKETNATGNAYEDSICASSSVCEKESFESFAEHFSETASFAYADVCDRKVLLVSEETFGNNVDSDLEAIEATIFALDSKGKIVSLGSIRSQGTLYPVTLLDGKLAVGGHQFVRVYGIRGDVPELVLDSYKEGEGEKMDSIFDAFSKGTPIKFNKLENLK